MPAVAAATFYPGFTGERQSYIKGTLSTMHLPRSRGGKLKVRRARAVAGQGKIGAARWKAGAAGSDDFAVGLDHDSKCLIEIRAEVSYYQAIRVESRVE